METEILLELAKFELREFELRESELREFEIGRVDCLYQVSDPSQVNY